jgi:hypothetical protein
MLLLLVMCAALLPLGVLMVMYPTDDMFKSYFGGWLCIACGGLGGVVCIMQIRAPFRLSVDGHGITWTQWTDQTIAWQAIGDVSVMTMSLQTFVGLSLRESEKCPTRHRLLNLAAPLNKRMFGADIFIPLSLLGTSSKNVLTAIDQYWPLPEV